MLRSRRAALGGAVVVLATVAAGCDAAVPAEDPFQCIGLPTATCESFLAEARQSVPFSAPVSAIIRCTVTCTEEEGDATILVVFANGQRVDYGTAWARAQGGGVDPAQPAPVDPGPGVTPQPTVPPAS